MSDKRIETGGVHPVTGGLAGGAAGVAIAFGGSALLPALGLPVLIAMGAFYGAFNGALLGFITRAQGR
jgi:predicted ABC-type sugar transport system permease subunit